jgi:polyisoprenoid-binding protein YceI
MTRFNFLKNFSVLALSVSLAAPAFATEYKVDPSHSHVGFTVSHLVSKVKGEFKDFDGSFNFDAKKPVTSGGKFVVKAASISTNNEKRDAHLKSPDFLDAQKYPELTLANIKIKAAGKDKYKMTGDLTIHGVTKPVTFDLEYNGEAKDPWGNMRAGFSANGKINRKDYGLTWNKALETGGLLVGNDVAIELQVEAIQEQPKKQENK